MRGAYAGNGATGGRISSVGAKASVCALWETSLPYEQVFHPEGSASLAPHPEYWQEIA